MADHLRILLDESIPEKLRLAFSSFFEVETVRFQGWAGLKNGALLRAAEVRFDILVTVDRGLRHQQNLGARDIAVIVLEAGGTTYADLLPLVQRAEDAFRKATPGAVIIVAA